METDYRPFFRASPVLAVALNEEGWLQDATDAWLRRFGYAREEIHRLRARELSSPAVTRRIENDYLPLLRRTGRLDNAPVDLYTRSGEQVDCLANVAATGDGRSVVVYTEMDEATRIEAQYLELYRETPAMMHTVDREGHIVHASDRWLSKMGYRRGEVLGRHITDFFADDSQLDRREVIDIIAQGDLDNVPRNYVTRSGAVIEALVSSRNDRGADGRVSRMHVAMKDMTAQNEAERRLRAAFEDNARLREELQRERDYLREEVQVSMNFGRIIGESPSLKRMLARVEAVAQTSASVLIQGESGTGKELVAHVIHTRSARSHAPLVKVNCASIPGELFESEFFGHVKGAFTGAHRNRIGRFQLADGGTLFMDEIGEIPLDLQGKLLRVLQEGEFEQVGGDRTRSVNVRVVAATNRNLDRAVEEGTFREDLYYRLSVFPIEVPPLRDRGDDIVQLASHFLEKICQDFGRRPLSLARRHVGLMRRYDWPGNVRELKNVIERAVILSRGKVLRLDLAMADIPRSASASAPAPAGPDGVGPMARPGPADGAGATNGDASVDVSGPSAGVGTAAGDDLAASAGPAVGDAPARGNGKPTLLTERQLLELQKSNLLAALKATGWRVSGPRGAASLVGLKPSTFTDRMKKFGIARPPPG